MAFGSSITENKAKLASPRTLLTETLSFYKAHFSLIVSIFVIPFILSLATILGRAFFEPGLRTFITLFALIANILAYFAFLYTVITSDGGHKRISFSLNHIFPIIVPLIWVGCLTTLATTGGSLLFIVPGMWLWVLLMFSSYALVGEHERGMKSLIRSYYYVRGLWWPIFGRFIFIILVIFVVSFVVSLIANLLGASTASFSIESIALQKQGISIVASIAGQLFSDFVSTPITIIFLFFLYQSVRAHKPGGPTHEEERTIRKTLGIFITIGLLFWFGLLVLAFVGLTAPTSPSLPAPSGALSATALLSPFVPFIL